MAGQSSAIDAAFGVVAKKAVIILLLLFVNPLRCSYAFATKHQHHSRPIVISRNIDKQHLRASSSFVADDSPPKVQDTTLPTTLTILLPAYDEELRIGETLEKYCKYIKSNSANNSVLPTTIDILVVDDGSTDGTAAVVRDFSEEEEGCRSVHIDCISLPTNQGKGEAVASGIQKLVDRRRMDIDNIGRIDGECLVLVADADGSGKISCLEEMVDALSNLIIASHQQQSNEPCTTTTPCWDEPAIIVGDRGYDGASRARSILRWGFRTAVRLICANLGVSDTQCGMKLMTLDAAAILYRNLNLKRWTHDVEVLYRAKLMGIPVADVPIQWQDKEGSKLVKSAGGSLQASLSMLLEILRMRIEYAIGRWQI